MAIKHKIKIKDKSVFKDKTISDDYKTGGAYKAILAMFAKHFKDKKKNENQNTCKSPVPFIFFINTNLAPLVKPQSNS